MDFNHKIDKANALYDEIEKIESKYKKYEDINHEDAIKIIRMHDIAINMTVDLIDRGAWS